MNDPGSEKLQELMNNNEFTDLLFSAQTPNAFVEILTENGITLDGISKEEAFAIFHSANSDELNEDSLDHVAGGVSVPITLALCVAGPIGIYCAIGAAAIGAFGVYCYSKARRK